MMSSRWPLADRDHRVDGLDPGLQRLMHAAPGDDAGSLDLHLAGVLALDGAQAVDRHAQPVDHAAQQGGTDRDLGDLARAFDGVAFLDTDVVAHDRDAHVVLFEIQDQTLDAARELDELTGHDAL